MISLPSEHLKETSEIDDSMKILVKIHYYIFIFYQLIFSTVSNACPLYRIWPKKKKKKDKGKNDKLRNLELTINTIFEFFPNPFCDRSLGKKLKSHYI